MNKQLIEKQPSIRQNKPKTLDTLMITSLNTKMDEKMDIEGFNNDIKELKDEISGEENQILVYQGFQDACWNLQTCLEFLACLNDWNDYHDLPKNLKYLLWHA